MLFFIFLLLILLPVGIFYYFNEKITKQRKQILILSKQNTNINNKLKKNYSNNFTVKYLDPNINSTMIITKCPLFLAPVEDSIVISTLSKGIQVDILDSAEISNQLWYEVSTQSINRINNKGWIKSDYIS